MTGDYQVIYSPTAKDDLKSIYSYIAFELREKATAAKQVGRIRKSIRELGSMPVRFVSVDWEPWASMGMHKMPVDNYVVYYLVDARGHTVRIIRIFYGGRDVERIMRGETE